MISLSPVAALGYRVSYLSEPGRIVLDFYDRAKSQDAGFLPLVRPVRTVAIDPGHGGRSFGSSKDGGHAGEGSCDGRGVKVEKCIDGERV